MNRTEIFAFEADRDHLSFEFSPYGVFESNRTSLFEENNIFAIGLFVPESRSSNVFPRIKCTESSI